MKHPATKGRARSWPAQAPSHPLQCKDMAYDLVTFGEAMLRLTARHATRLEQAAQFDAQIGGAEFNVACGAARLGLQTAWVSRLPENALGRMARNQARLHGVETRHLAWSEAERLGLYFVETGAAPRASGVLYDRAHSALAACQASDFDWPGILTGARGFHVTGITPALSAGTAAATVAALQAARKAGCLVSYDLNYRRKLWTPQQARATQEPLLSHVDLLITNEEDAHLVLGISAGGANDSRYANKLEPAHYEPVGRQLCERYGLQAVAITLRGSPSVWRNHWSGVVYAEGKMHAAPEFELEVVDRIGGGDAFAAGLLAARLEGGDWSAAVSFAVAYSALKHSLPGDVNWASRRETEALLKGGSLRVAR